MELLWEVQLGVLFKGDFHSTVGVCGDGSACTCRYSDQVPDLDVVDLIDPGGSIGGEVLGLIKGNLFRVGWFEGGHEVLLLVQPLQLLVVLLLLFLLL